METKITIQVTNVNEFRMDIDKFITFSHDKVRTVIERNSNNIRDNAKAKAAKDTGKLIKSIATRFVNDGFTGIIYAGAEHSAYIEFGTRRGIRIPSGYEDLASQFKGAGNAAPPTSALKEWAERHGMTGKEYVLSKAIQRRGTKPQPFLIPAFEMQKAPFIADIYKIYNKMGSEF